jgi:hypothetical protein
MAWQESIRELRWSDSNVTRFNGRCASRGAAQAAILSQAAFQGAGNGNVHDAGKAMY